SWAKVTASSSAPHRVMPQPIRLAAPYGAKVAGNRKVPEPIMLPTTRAVVDQKPSGRREVVIEIRQQRHGPDRRTRRGDTAGGRRGTGDRRRDRAGADYDGSAPARRSSGHL